MDYHSIFLFQGLTEADIAQMEHDRCLRRKAFARRQTIFHTGDTVHEIGIVLRGAVHIESIDLWGSKSILSEVGEGQAFAETYAFCGEPLMVDVLAAADCEVLFLDTAALSRPHAERGFAGAVRGPDDSGAARGDDDVHARVPHEFVRRRNARLGHAADAPLGGPRRDGGLPDDLHGLARALPGARMRAHDDRVSRLHRNDRVVHRR